jgi:hypothetical protein
MRIRRLALHFRLADGIPHVGNSTDFFSVATKQTSGATPKSFSSKRDVRPRNRTSIADACTRIRLRRTKEFLTPRAANDVI